MLRKLACTLFVLGIVSAVASAVPFTGYRTTDTTDLVNYGVFGTAGWSTSSDGLEITWAITDNLNGTWTYRYDLTDEEGETLRKTPSHIIIELSDVDVVITPDSLEIKQDWSTQPGNSNPGLPGSLLGVKIGWGSEDYVEFIADRAPKWGDFYAKDGVDGGDDVYAYNLGFGTEPADLATDFSPWIAVPDTEGGGPPQGTVIPEPTTIALLGLGLGGLFLRRRRRA